MDCQPKRGSMIHHERQGNLFHQFTPRGWAYGKGPLLSAESSNLNYHSRRLTCRQTHHELEVPGTLDRISNLNSLQSPSG